MLTDCPDAGRKRPEFRQISLDRPVYRAATLQSESFRMNAFPSSFSVSSSARRLGCSSILINVFRERVKCVRVSLCFAICLFARQPGSDRAAQGTRQN